MLFRLALALLSSLALADDGDTARFLLTHVEYYKQDDDVSEPIEEVILQLQAFGKSHPETMARVAKELLASKEEGMPEHVLHVLSLASSREFDPYRYVLDVKMTPEVRK